MTMSSPQPRPARRISVSASIPGWMYRMLEKECFKRNVSFSQVITERIQQGIAFEQQLEHQEQLKAQILLEEVKKDALSEGQS